MIAPRVAEAVAAAAGLLYEPSVTRFLPGLALHHEAPCPLAELARRRRPHAGAYRIEHPPVASGTAGRTRYLEEPRVTCLVACLLQCATGALAFGAAGSERLAVTARLGGDDEVPPTPVAEAVATTALHLDKPRVARLLAGIALSPQAARTLAELARG